MVLFNSGDSTYNGGEITTGGIDDGWDKLHTVSGVDRASSTCPLMKHEFFYIHLCCGSLDLGWLVDLVEIIQLLLTM